VTAAVRIDQRRGDATRLRDLGAVSAEELGHPVLEIGRIDLHLVQNRFLVYQMDAPASDEPRPPDAP
jgi:hypothetical protein